MGGTSTRLVNCAQVQDTTQLKMVMLNRVMTAVTRTLLQDSDAASAVLPGEETPGTGVHAITHALFRRVFLSLPLWMSLPLYRPLTVPLPQYIPLLSLQDVCAEALPCTSHSHTCSHCLA